MEVTVLPKKTTRLLLTVLGALLGAGLVRELLRRVMVYPGGRVSIEWSFRDELLAVLHAQRDTPGAQ